MLKIERRRYRPGIHHDNAGILPECLSQSKSQHGRFMDGIDSHGQDEIRAFEFAHGNRREDGRMRPSLFPADPLEHGQRFEAAAIRGNQGNCIRAGIHRDLVEPPGSRTHGFSQRGILAVHSCPAWPTREICIRIPEPSPVANEVAVDRLVETGLDAHHLPVPGAGDGAAAQGTVDAQEGNPLQIPPPRLVAGRPVRIDARRADIHEVSGKRAFERAVPESTEIDPVCDLHRAEIPVSGKVLVEPRAAVAVNTPVHFVGYELPEVLVMIGALPAGIAPQPVPSRHRFVLQQALPALVAHGAVVRVIHHEPLDDLPSESHRLLIRGRNHHAVLGINHATHLKPLERAVNELHRTHPAGSRRPQRLVIAEARDHDPKPLGRFNHFGPFGDFDFQVVYNQPWHGDPQRGRLNGHFFRRICSRTSSSKKVSRLSTGEAAPGARAQ